MASGWMTRLLDSGTEGTLALALALGHELGIFEVIMASPQPLTSLQIAQRGKLKERYVREWLGCVVAGEVIQVQKGEPESYFIAEDHKGVLDKIGIAARLFASYAVRYDAVKACFRQEGPAGVSHSNYPDVFSVFHVMRASSASHTLDTMLPIVPGLIQKLEEGIDAVDFGCGTGVLVLEMAKRYPHSRFRGSDISPQGLAIARRHLADSQLTNVTFTQDDLLNLSPELHGKFDWALTYDVIHDLSEPLRALNQISSCLKPGGLYVMGDLHTPKDRCGIAGDDVSMGLYGMSTFLCLPASATAAPGKTRGDKKPGEASGDKEPALERGEGSEHSKEPCLGPGAAWSVEEAQALIAESSLQLVDTVSSKPYFAFHICQPAPS